MRRKKTSRKRKTTRRTKRKRRGRNSGSLPKSPKKGSTHSIVRNGRRISFEATGRAGFGKWRIVSNTKA